MVEPERFAPNSGDLPLVAGGSVRGWRDTYHELLTLSWWAFFLLAAGIYMALNAVFGLLYWLDPRGLGGARVGSYADAFNFSVETLGTIGYGAISPQSAYANALVATEAFLNIILSALATGVIFARVSRPTARIRFAGVALITQWDGRRTFMFRVANERANYVLEADVSVVLVRWAVTAEGYRIRRLEEIRMQRSRSPMLALTWTVLHTIDETSPLYGVTPDSLAATRAEVIIVLSGVDESFAQRVHARHSYIASEIVFDRIYHDVVETRPDGRLVVDYSRFDAVVQGRTSSPGERAPAERALS